MDAGISHGSHTGAAAEAGESAATWRGARPRRARAGARADTVNTHAHKRRKHTCTHGDPTDAYAPAAAAAGRGGPPRRRHKCVDGFQKQACTHPARFSATLPESHPRAPRQGFGARAARGKPAGHGIHISGARAAGGGGGVQPCMRCGGRGGRGAGVHMRCAAMGAGAAGAARRACGGRRGRERA
ncbi:MAG: hypothetical protein J3K34DRAFT_144225 [Monoraphidium minutum]|nr:MAG: hypothetical protein J3K34DRAFT_144225 [Monoraphidium minutum]